MNFSFKAFLVLSLIFISQNSFAEGLDCVGIKDQQFIGGLQDKLLSAAAGLDGCVDTKALTDFRAKATGLEGEQKECATSYSKARGMCLEECSPSIGTIVPMVNTLLGSLRMGGVVDACSKMNNAMNIVQTGLTAYSAACGGTKVMCDSSCAKASTRLKGINAALPRIVVIPTLTSEVTVSACNTKVSSFQTQAKSALAEEEGEDEKTVAFKKKTCSGYAMHLTSAFTGIAQALMSAKQAHNCDQKAQAAAIDSGKIDCSKPENAAMPNCICEKNPRAAGCSGEVSGGTTSFAGSTGATNGNTPTGNANLAGPTAKVGPDGMQKGDTGGGGGAGAPVGGSAGNLDGGSGIGEAKKEAGVIKKINTNLYGGEGGGGGGGAFGRGGNGAPDKSLAKDPNFLKQREIASTRAQVTSPQGKSNWEKVSERYTTQKATLIGQ